MLDVSYGYHSKAFTDERIYLADLVGEDFSVSIQPGMWIVDVIPIRAYLHSFLVLMCIETYIIYLSQVSSRVDTRNTVQEKGEGDESARASTTGRAVCDRQGGVRELTTYLFFL